MTTAISQQRVNELTLELMPEAAFAVEPSFATPLRGCIASIDLGPTDQPEIEDPAYRLDGGAHKTIPGILAGQAMVPIGMKAEGIDAIPLDAAAAAHTLQTRLLETVFGKASELLKRCTVKAASAPTTTAVVDNTVDAHKPAAGYGIAPFFVPTDPGTPLVGEYWPRPYLYIDAGDIMTLAMALPAAPAEGGDIGACILSQYSHRPSSPPTVSMRVIGNDEQQNVGIQGCVAALELAEQSSTSVPLLSFKTRVASATRDPVGWTRVPPTNQRGRVFAGAEVRIGKVGGTTSFLYPVRKIGLAIRTWEPIDDVSPLVGVSGYGTGAPEAGYFDLTIPHTSDPDSVVGAVGYTSWLDFWEDNLSEEFQILATVGRRIPGHAQTFYCHRAIVKKPSRAELAGFDCRKLRFVPAQRTAADITAGTTHEFVHIAW
jgi:hypothetical protein